MWSSDTLFALEQRHLVQLALWSGASLALGVLLLVFLRIRRAEAPLLTHFALQMTLWGAGELLLAALWWHDLAARDFAGAVRLTTLLRFAIVAEVACLTLGATLAIAGWRLTRTLATLGAGVAVVVQCAALLLLDTSLLARVTAPGSARLSAVSDQLSASSFQPSAPARGGRVSAAEGVADSRQLPVES